MGGNESKKDRVEKATFEGIFTVQENDSIPCDDVAVDLSER